MHYSCKMRYSVVIKAKIEFLLYFQGLCMDISILHCWYVVSASLMICTLTFLNWNIIFSHSCTCMLLRTWFRTAAKYCFYNITTSLYINVCIKIFGNLLTRIVVKKLQWKKNCSWVFSWLSLGIATTSEQKYRLLLCLILIW